MDKSKNKVRRKVTQACENCREKRVKCSAGRPSCESCLQLNITCIYNAVTKKRGPRSGYIEEIVTNRVQKELEKYVTESLISKKSILSLAKNNEEMFKSSEILKKYLEEAKNEDNIRNVENEISNSNTESKNENIVIKTENVIKKEILSNLSKVDKTEVLIVNTLNKSDNFGTALIYNYPYYFDYNLISVDYNLIDTYFRYSHFYCPILIKEVFMDRLKQNTLLPGLLLAVYASACLYRPNPDINMSKKYSRLSHIYCSIYYHDSNIQTVQTIALLANCACGTNFCWISFGIALRMSYLLKLDEDDKNLSKVYNEERKLTFWYVITKDMVFSVITGRSYRYDLYNFLRSPATGSYLLSLKSSRSSINLILQIILANLLQKVIQYVRRRNSRMEEIDLVEKEIEYWFRILEPEYNYQISNSNDNRDSIGEIITSIHFDIIFSTLKIILYRHKPSSVITNRKMYYPGKLMNSFFKKNEDMISKENVDNQIKFSKDILSSPYDFDEIDGFKHRNSEKIDYDFFLSFGFELLKRKRNKFKENIELSPQQSNFQLKKDNIPQQSKLKQKQSNFQLKKDNIPQQSKLKQKVNENFDNQMHVLSSENTMNKNNNVPLSFKINNYIYFKKRSEETLVIDYTTRYMETLDASGIYMDKQVDSSLKGNNLKFNIMPSNVKNIEIKSEEQQDKKNILKRSHSQDMPDSGQNNYINISPSIKRYKSTNSTVNDDIDLSKKENLFLDLDPFKINNDYEEKVSESLSLINSNNKDTQTIVDNVKFQQLDNINPQKNDGDFIKLINSKIESSYIQKYYGTENTNYSEFLKAVLETSKLKEQFKDIELYLNTKYDDNLNEEPFIEDNALENSMSNLNECYSIASNITEKIKILGNYLDPGNMTYNFVLCWSFYQIGVIYMIWYVNYGKEEDYKMIKYYENLLERSSKSYAAVMPYLSKFREMIQEAETSVKNGIRKLVIKDIL